jgi:hypothetical protein
MRECLHIYLGTNSYGWRAGTASQLSNEDYTVPDGGFNQVVGVVVNDGCSVAGRLTGIFFLTFIRM